MRHQGLFLAILALLNFYVYAAQMDWWEDTSLYHIYTKSFKDSDGDGIGDLKGITEKLEYLKEIGVQATWLSPIFKSPMVGIGYDTSDYYAIDPLFGTMDDFDELIKKAKKLGIKIILDFVPNHSSDQCEWFQKSINREDGYDDFYVWADGINDPENPGKKLPPSNWDAVFNGSMWTWNDKRQQYYLHQFLEEEPDLNFRNPEVQKVMLDVMKFWLDRGVDGFHISYLSHLYEKVNDDGTYPDEPLDENPFPSASSKLKHIYTRDLYETVELLYEWRAFLEAYRKQNGGDTRILLAEAHSPIDVLDSYFGNGTHFGAHLPINFDIINLPAEGNARVLQSTIDKWMAVMWKNHKTANWLASNHDGLRATSHWGQGRKDLFQIIIAALPGVAVTYYGDEIGMSNIRTDCPTCSIREKRTFGRTPFQWNDDISGGFSTSNLTWIPVVDDYKTGVNVKAERGISRSSLNIFKGMQELRQTAAFKAFKEVGGFKYGAINANVFVIIRSSSNEEYRVLMNMGPDPEVVGILADSGDTEDYIYEYRLLTNHSPHRLGERIDVRKISLMPFEGVVLKKVFSKQNV